MTLANDLARALAEEARLVMLKELAKQADGRLSDILIRKVLDIYGYRRDRDWIETQLRKLESLSAVSLNEAGEILIARIERAGRDHLEERVVLAGVARPNEIER